MFKSIFPISLMALFITLAIACDETPTTEPTTIETETDQPTDYSNARYCIPFSKMDTISSLIAKDMQDAESEMAVYEQGSEKYMANKFGLFKAMGKQLAVKQFRQTGLLKNTITKDSENTQLDLCVGFNAARIQLKTASLDKKQIKIDWEDYKRFLFKDGRTMGDLNLLERDQLTNFSLNYESKKAFFDMLIVIYSKDNLKL